MPKKQSVPTPEELLRKAESVELGFDVRAYTPVMWRLRAKGLTFRAIASWLSEELGVAVTYTQVFRIMKDDVTVYPEAPEARYVAEDEAHRRHLRERELEELRSEEEGENRP